MQIELHDRLLDIPRDVLVRVVYQSRTDMDDHELEQVIATSQRNNAATGITGVLVHADGLLMQVLEGGADVVSALLTVIEDDPRHCDFDLVRLDAVTERSFGDWSMNRIELESRRLIQILYAYINREPGSSQLLRDYAAGGGWKRLSALESKHPPLQVHTQRAVQ
jgi:hypothetical protein